MCKRRNYYTVYLRKTDELVASGSAEDCAAAMNQSVDSFYSMVCRVRKGTNRKYEIYIEEQ